MGEEKRNDLVIPEAEAKVREELAAERAARVQTERLFAARGAAPVPPPAPKEPDFLGKFKEEAQLPDGQADALARGIHQRARSEVAGMVGPELAKVRQEIAAARYEAQLDRLRERHPELDADKMAAAVGAAAAEIQARGLNLAPADHMRLVEQKAAALFPGKPAEKKETAEVPPFVEGKSNLNRAEVPGGSGKMAAEGKETEGPEPHPLAEFYFGEGSEVPVYNHDKDLNKHLEEMVGDHVARKNDYLMDRGVNSRMPRVSGPMGKRYREKAKAAKAAGAR